MKWTPILLLKICLATAQIQFGQGEQRSPDATSQEGKGVFEEAETFLLGDLLENQVQQIVDEHGSSEGTSCECAEVKDCRWAVDALEAAKGLSKTSAARNGLVRLLQKRKAGCQGFQIRCCQETSVQETQSSIEFGVTGNRRLNHNNSSRGDWIPVNNCGERLGTFFLIGGVDTFIGEMPFMALIALRLPRGGLLYGCGGTLINKYYVLTAAHCFKNLAAEHVLIGEHDRTTDPDCVRGRCTNPAQKIEVESIIIHKKYKDFADGYDIALIRLKKPAKMFTDDQNSLVGPVCLPVGDNCKNVYPACTSPPSVFNSKRRGRRFRRVIRPDTQLLRVVGWGKTSNEEFNISQSSVPQKLDIPVRTTDLCKNLNPSHNEDIQLCAGGEADEDSCRGDSGGPLLLGGGSTKGEPWIQMGIVSFGPSHCGSHGFAATYTYVPPFMNWIVDTIRP